MLEKCLCMWYTVDNSKSINMALISKEKERQVLMGLVWTVSMVEVVAALICEKGRYLICQRPEYKGSGLLWEFVGGKVEAGESKEMALVRECREELSIEVSVGEAFCELTHAYPDITVHLTLFHARILSGTPTLLEHNALAWVTSNEMGDFAFCPADLEIIEKLKAFATI